ncbi:hypothetical protein Y032_0340g2991 [Ancylostoma ceylanicum]|uniref:Uncharacterized protein n=1 Tax=Ancylostoma ceylanicum TaxID=53326 RepID=A0A016RY48_9BILA|nr:hypothetical protein Y032_0340g2991 [Ancylostoma ceylanicum]
MSDAPCTPLPSCRREEFTESVTMNSIILLDKMAKIGSMNEGTHNERITQDDRSPMSRHSSPCSSDSDVSRESTPHEESPIQAAKKAVFNMLYQYQAIPVRAKILADCILSTLDEAEVTNLLDSAGWTRNDYLRGYRTMETDPGMIPVPTEPHPVAYHSAASQQIRPAATCHPVAAIVPSSDNLHKLKERKLTRFIVV